MRDAGGGCCRCCFSFIVTAGLTALFMWLSLRTSDPVCSIQDLYVPALNKTANSTANTTIYFDLKLDNENKDKGIFYDDLNLTFYYAPNFSSPIATQTFPSFYQGHGKKARRKQLVETHGVPWDEVHRDVINGATTVFRVDLATAVRFKIVGWKTKRHHLRLGANLTVTDTGTAKKPRKKKGIRLKSGAPEHPCYRARLAPLTIILTLLFII